MRVAKVTNNSNSIKAVIFDVGGVLHESNSATKDALSIELGLDQSTLDNIWSTQVPLLVCGAINEAEFWQVIAKQYGVRQVDVAENLLSNAFTEQLKVHTPIIKLIQRFRAAGVKLAILSNTIEPHARALKKAGVYDGFDYVILSHEVGLQKPDSEIYRYTLDTIGAVPSETIFIDDIPINITSAERLGMHGVLFTNPQDTAARLLTLTNHLFVVK